ncbi:MAG: 3-methyl-2-oxobutanoate dehydrogenase subunit VorB [Planctomycetota bacterium]|nr:MAG: 3-methyl-2-oxobutanoate dehydrogenase subunit VorB [Planctomycetota bacterium]
MVSTETADSPTAARSTDAGDGQTTKRLVKGNEAVAWGAIHGGCEAFFGYPITPQNEIPELLSDLMPRYGRVFLQAESEVASINMVYGAAAAGHRVMTSSSSPGISLMMEGLSYCAGARLPCVLVNVQRGGPGLGNIAAAQGDYFQAVKGGGHGDYRCIVLAPWNVQEMFEFPALAFDLADRYRMPAFVLADAVLGSMLEPAEIPPEPPPVRKIDKPWATTGRGNRTYKNVANSLYLDIDELSAHNESLQKVYAEVAANEVRWDGRQLDDAEHVIVAYGISARVALSAMTTLRRAGLKFGLFRPITLFPFPIGELRELATRCKSFHVFELSAGQMVEDVRLAVEQRAPVEFFGKMGGVLPTPDELADVLRRQARK